MVVAVISKNNRQPVAGKTAHVNAHGQLGYIKNTIGPNCYVELNRDKPNAYTHKVHRNDLVVCNKNCHTCPVNFVCKEKSIS